MRFSRRPEKNPEDPNDDFSDAHKEVNYIFGGPDSYEPKRKQKLIAREVLLVGPATLEYLRWSEVPITFDPVTTWTLFQSRGGIL
jgi:hypothetical protein